MAGVPCVDPRAHPKPNGLTTTSIYKLLDEDHAGCGLVTGIDSGLSAQAGTMTLKEFASNNPTTFHTTKLGTEFS